MKGRLASFSTIALFPWNCCPSHVRHDASICVEQDGKRERDRERGWGKREELQRMLFADERSVKNNTSFASLLLPFFLRYNVDKVWVVSVFFHPFLTFNWGLQYMMVKKKQKKKCIKVELLSP